MKEDKMIICESDFDTQDPENNRYFMEEIDFWLDHKTNSYYILRRRWDDKVFEFISENCNDNTVVILCASHELRTVIAYANRLRRQEGRGSIDRICDHTYPNKSMSCKISMDLEGRGYQRSKYDLGNGSSDF